MAQNWLELSLACEKICNLAKETVALELSSNFPFIEQPQASAKEHAVSLLQLLGGLDKLGNCTVIGKKMARLPLHPRLSRVLVEAEGKSCGAIATLYVALISEGGILKRQRFSEPPDEGHCDLLFQAQMALRTTPSTNIDAAAVARVKRLWQQLLKLTNIQERAVAIDPFFNEENIELELCLLAGFGDRVAARLPPPGRTSSASSASFSSSAANIPSGTATGNGSLPLALCAGGQAFLAPSSCAKLATHLIAFDAELVRIGNKGAPQVQVNMASEVSVKSLQQMETYLNFKAETVWDNETARSRTYERTYYGQIMLEEKQVSRRAEEEALLFQNLKNEWPKPFDAENIASFEGFQVRKSLAAKLGLKLNLPDFFNELDFDLLLSHIAEGKRSYAEVLEKSLWDYMHETLSYTDATQLEKLLPAKIKIGAGRSVVVHYEEGKPPWVSSRLQDFFGTTSTPKIAEGKLGLVVHLLSPNGQAVQVTQDLEGFWLRSYADVRKELARKYPRHFWPDNPATAEPPPLRPPRLPRR